MCGRQHLGALHCHQLAPRIRCGGVATCVAGFANVSTHGRMSDITCSYQEESDLVFSKAVERAGRRARLSSAMLNGKKRKVRLQFTAIFLRYGENEEIRILNNVRNNADKYGLEYIGAQRIDSREFPDNCSMARDWFALVQITVAADGSPRNFEMDPSSRKVPLGCTGTIKNRMLTSKFIPAFYDGAPVDSSYTEPWFYHYYFE